MLRLVEIISSIVSSLIYLFLIYKATVTWNRIKHNSFYLLPLLLSFYILFVHKFLVIVSAVFSWQFNTKITIAHSLVFAIMFQSIFFIDKFYNDRNLKLKALSFSTSVLLCGYVLGLEGIALTVALVEVYFIFISLNAMLSYSFAIYFLIDTIYVVDAIYKLNILIYAYLLEPVATFLAYKGFQKIFSNLLQKEEC